MMIQTQPRSVALERRAAREVVVITGASAGVGRAVARAYAQQGAAIGLFARGRDGLRGVEEEVIREGGRALVVAGDVANPEEVEEAARAVEEAFGPIDVWINNAMLSVFARAIDMDPTEFRRVTDVTYLGYVHGTLAALRRMLPRNRGVIVQVGSALAYRSIPLQSAYCAAKHAVAGFTDALRTELLHDGSKVHLTMVQLPALNTPQFGWVRSRLPMRPQPVPPIYQPEVAARAIVWAAKQRRREVYVGLPTLAAILGQRVMPGVLDRFLARTGFDAQQTDEPEPRARPDNLWLPVAGDHGARGRFDARASASCAALWVTMHRGWLVLGALAIASIGALASSRFRRAR